MEAMDARNEYKILSGFTRPHVLTLYQFWSEGSPQKVGLKWPFILYCCRLSDTITELVHERDTWLIVQALYTDRLSGCGQGEDSEEVSEVGVAIVWLVDCSLDRKRGESGLIRSLRKSILWGTVIYERHRFGGGEGGEGERGGGRKEIGSCDSCTSVKK